MENIIAAMSIQMKETLHDDEYYLQLTNNPIRFEAVSQLTNVFFDDSNRQVFNFYLYNPLS